MERFREGEEAAQSFDRSRQNVQKHQRGSPPSLKSAASAGKFAGRSGSIRTSSVGLLAGAGFRGTSSS
jgi:hypothetical protein